MFKFLKSLHDHHIGGSITRAAARELVRNFHESVGPLMLNVPANKHQLDNMMIANAQESASTAGPPRQLRACEHTIFHGKFAETRACPECKELAQDCKVVFVNSVLERLKCAIAAAPDKYRHTPSFSEDGGTVASVWDGTEYRRKSRELTGPWDQIISLHTDGVSVTTFNGKSFYPILCVPRNLRSDQATKSENIIIAALWEGTASTKGAQTLITPLVDELRVQFWLIWPLLSCRVLSV